MVVPNNIGFPTENDHFGVWGYHYFRKHPFIKTFIGAPFHSIYNEAGLGAHLVQGSGKFPDPKKNPMTRGCDVETIYPTNLREGSGF